MQAPQHTARGAGGEAAGGAEERNGYDCLLLPTNVKEKLHTRAWDQWSIDPLSTHEYNTKIGVVLEYARDVLSTPDNPSSITITDLGETGVELSKMVGGRVKLRAGRWAGG